MPNTYEQRMAYLNLAEKKANNKEFKQLWKEKQQQLEKNQIKSVVKELIN
jgi:hypothetical protein